MDLVIKPTERCNFKCTFCSSTSIADDAGDELSLDQIKAFLVRFPETETIIVNGGDPLMMTPDYYQELLDYLDDENLDVIVSITSNLWPFYKKPERWRAVFQHPKFSVITSFQYGDKRLKGDFTPFTEEEFWKVSDCMLDICGYRPDFISVIDEDNADRVLDHVRLAREMEVECKANYAMSSGPSVEIKGRQMGNEGSLYLLADMYGHYVDIWKAGLTEWEYNTKQMVRKLRGELTTCPLSRQCDAGIRTLQPSGDYYSCPAFADDKKYAIDFNSEMTGELTTPLQNDPEISVMKYSCYGCPMFSICNSCKKTTHDHKALGLVEHHCQKMKRLAPDIIEANGMTGQLEPTPYVNESGLIATSREA